MNDLSKKPRSAAEDASDFGDACAIAEADRIRRGEPDPLGDTVDRILVGTDRFIIYSVVQEGAPSEDPDPGDVAHRPRGILGLFGAATGRAADHVWLRTKYPKDYKCARELRANLGAIVAELAHICDVVDSICRSGSLDIDNSRSLRRRATEMMARAMELAYEGNGADANALLERLRKNVTTLRDSKNRMRYVQGNLLALGVILGLWVCLRFLDLTSSLVLVGEADIIDVHALDILALGAVGAFFSVSASVGAIQVDHSVSFWEMVYTGFVRIPIGVIAAGVAIFLISGGWMFASIEPGLLPWTYLLFGFVAGFSELFVPNALKQVEAASSASAPSRAVQAPT